MLQACARLLLQLPLQRLMPSAALQHPASLRCSSQQLRQLLCRVQEQQQASLQQATLLPPGPLQSLLQPGHRCCCVCQLLLLPPLLLQPNLLLHLGQIQVHPM
jgi:hypothetical protein